MARADARVDDPLAAARVHFAVIPTVSSAYPNWDEEDRQLDHEHLADGRMVLDHGHQQPVTSVADGRLAEIAHMPSDSPWPVLLATALLVTFGVLVVDQFVLAGAAAGLVALTLLGWHAREPEEATA